VELCKKHNIHVPVIPGIKILTSKKQLTMLPKTFHIDIPLDLSKEVLACKNDEEVKQAGIEWCIAQCRELIKHNVPCIHFYTMGNSVPTRKVAQAIF
jgi:methylenetetrahydrofolate reductase (NADPH)